MQLVNATSPHIPISVPRLLVLLAVIGALAAIAIPTAAIGSGPSPKLSLDFPTGEAHASGSRTSVWTTCRGPEAHVCNGTLTLRTSGAKHSVPFSVIAGTNQNLTVPLGADSSVKRIVAIVRTVQANGNHTRSREVLHLG